MLEATELARVKPSVSEQQLRQRWRGALLWVLRVLLITLLLLVLKTLLIWPMRDIDEALDRCMTAEAQDARVCMRREIEVRRVVIDQARVELVAFLALTLMTFSVALWVRFGLRTQLREQYRFSSQVFDAVPLSMSLRTPGGVFLRVNTAFEKRYGLTRTGVAGRHFSQFFPEAVVREVERVDAQALGSTDAVEEETDSSRPGRPQHTVMRAQAVRDEDGTALGIVHVHEDITALRLHEAELVSTNEKLRRLSAQMIDAQEAERRRIARDLHDQVGQILTALKLQLGMVSRKGAVPDAAASLMMAREFAEEALRHTRDLSASLHPHLLDDLGLEAALGWLVDRFVRPLVPTVELRCRLARPRTAQSIELVAFRVVQEALTNAVRHAHASRIGVILEAEGDVLSIEVIDDGVGFEGGDAGVEAKRGTSLGLAAMGDRVSEVGGELAMESTPGVGTRLRARLPWKQVEA